jgi:hypothetical protein
MIVVKGLVYGFSLLLELPLVVGYTNVGQRIVIISSLHESLIDSAKFPVCVSKLKHLYTPRYVDHSQDFPCASILRLEIQEVFFRLLTQSTAIMADRSFIRALNVFNL